MVGTKVNLPKSKVELQDYIEVDGYKYYVDNKKVVFEPTKRELAIAVWLSKKLDKKVKILPRINIPEGIKAADYSIDGDNWDLKIVISNRNNAIYTSVRRESKQSNNFIFDISKSKLTIKAVVKQVEYLYKSKKFNWLNNIIIKKNNDMELVLKNKKSR